MSAETKPADPTVDVGASHRVVLTFANGGLTSKLVCPESGCAEAGYCGQCGRDLHDDESTPCYDCSDPRPEGCWVKSWFDNLMAEEMLVGSVEVVIDPAWDYDHLEAKIIGVVASEKLDGPE